MSNVQRNSISEFNLETMSFSELAWGYATGISISKGQGRNKEYSYRNGVMTELGDIEESVWYQLMEKLIEREQEDWLLTALIQWEKEHNYQGLNAADLRKQALHLHSVRLFDCPEWVCSLPFNQRFRPEIYTQTSIVVVKTECCDLPGEVTQEQIDRAYAGTVHCPHCGIWSKFSICDESGEEE